MDERQLRDAFGNDHTERWLAGCAILAVIILLAIVPVGMAVAFCIMSEPH